ncbi:thiamine phosphate synthase [Frisingicoccus sp.]|uniref:thiamine phosphate synthase n=1 Tax=Frisingicoccus sp. TaxID=1918627 RepID=UPI002EC80A7E|nr:thiamine phosphate synthase [Frisingicoccus sp.]
MSDILCVTNRSLCTEDFLIRVEKLAEQHPKGIILREKDLSEESYKSLAESVIEICRRYDTPCILHNFYETARKLNHTAIHLSMQKLRSLSEEERKAFSVLGASCHSVAEAKETEQLGCTYITAGHIFDTDCKKGLPGRGIPFLREICQSVNIPVYAIGGICAENMDMVRKTGAAGACVMSGAMVCEDAEKYLAAFEEK